MNVYDFEQAVWFIEGIRIVIRDRDNAEVTDYPFERAAAGNTSSLSD